MAGLLAWRGESDDEDSRRIVQQSGLCSNTPPMEPEDLDLSWLPEKPSEDATEPVQLALVAEVDKVTTGKLGEKERELLLSAAADNIKTRILTHTMKSMLMVRSGKGRRIAGIAHYADWKTLNVEHPIVAAAIRNL